MADWDQQRYGSIDQAFKDQNIWPIGKHKGKRITTLSTHYLIWASENLTGTHKGTADRELVRRYQAKDSAHKVGGPDNKSAVLGG